MMISLTERSKQNEDAVKHVNMARALRRLVNEKSDVQSKGRSRCSTLGENSHLHCFLQNEICPKPSDEVLKRKRRMTKSDGRT
jgi:hypothetical protein